MEGTGLVEGRSSWTRVIFQAPFKNFLNSLQSALKDPTAEQVLSRFTCSFKGSPKSFFVKWLLISALHLLCAQQCATMGTQSMHGYMFPQSQWFSWGPGGVLV